ncbi:MAG: polymerase subunit sigma-70 [Marmoricola sp.]|nr:polymerase subunit sigma-70 [Marmoricola sp.]
MLAGDDEAFRIVYRAVHPRLERYLSALVGRNDAEDVASDTWAQAFRDLDRFSGDADGFRGWITTIGRNRALDHLRAQGRRPLASFAPEDLPERVAPDDIEATIEGLLGTDAALRLISALPAEQAEAVLLRAVMGLDAKTVARIVGRTSGAVRTAAYRGLRALATQLAEQPAESGSDTSVPPNAEELR